MAGIMLGRALAAVALLAATAAAAQPEHAAPPHLGIAAIERQLRLPHDAAPLRSHVRYYALVQVPTDEELPFTTVASDAARLPKSGWVIAAILIQPTWGRVDGPPRAVWTDRKELPQRFHGGRRVVNAVIDPSSGVTLASWCNVTGLRQPPPSARNFRKNCGRFYLPMARGDPCPLRRRRQPSPGLRQSAGARTRTAIQASKMAKLSSSSRRLKVCG